MHSRRSLAILSTAALCALSALQCAAAKETLHFVERPETDLTIQRDGKSDSIGDLLVFANPMFDSTNTRRVGTAQGSCVRVTAGFNWECSFALIIDNDRIVVQGNFTETGDPVFAITGGTGRYVGAKGLVRVRVRDPEPLPNGNASAYDLFCDIH